MAFSFWRILAFLLAKKTLEAWLPASHPGSGQVLPALALLLPKDLLNSILGLQHSSPLLMVVAKSPACLIFLPELTQIVFC